MIESFTLGTANLGMAYGVTNSKTYFEESSRSVLEFALNKGIRNFDTAPGYGSAENLLGEVGSKIEELNVVTKIPKLAEYTFDSVMASIQESLSKLGVAQLHGILFHDPEILNIELEMSLTDRILGTNLVKRVGLSAYREVEIKRAKEMHPDWSIFQIPEK
jgi:aryl-alcohol dehydrogenase-like predicted oxidoreductase